MIAAPHALRYPERSWEPGAHGELECQQEPRRLTQCDRAGEEPAPEGRSPDLSPPTIDAREPATESNYLDHPIRKMAEPNGVRAKWLRRRPEYPEVLARLAGSFSTVELNAWIEAATKAADAWSKRNGERYAGQDLFDAQRGVYDLAALIGMVREAAKLKPAE